MNDSLPTPPIQEPAPSSSNNPSIPTTIAGLQALNNTPSSSSGQGESSISLDGILTKITTTETTTEDQKVLNDFLRTIAGKEVGETILASLLPGRGDPLEVLDVKRNTLGMLYILSARLHSNPPNYPSQRVVEDFCRNFDAKHARLAPQRVTLVARGIVQLANGMGEPKYAVKPLHDLLVRFPRDLSFLTPLHALFVTACVSSRQFSVAIPVLSIPATNIDQKLCPDLHYNDNLVYHYVGGIAFVALKRWKEAEEFFEIVVGSPAQAPSALQLEAGKKLILVQLIKDGRASNLPKYISPILQRLIKNSPYYALVKHYPLQVPQMKILVDKERETFTKDQNAGLLQQTLNHAPRWAIRKLTETYLTLSLSEIGKAIGMDGMFGAVQSIVLSMIECGEINASISTDGTVTFHDDDSPLPAKMMLTKTEVDRALKEAQAQAAILRELERDIGSSKDYLLKAVRSKDDTWSGSVAPDEDIMYGAPSAGWSEDI